MNPKGLFTQDVLLCPSIYLIAFACKHVDCGPLVILDIMSGLQYKISE